MPSIRGGHREAAREAGRIGSRGRAVTRREHPVQSAAPLEFNAYKVPLTQALVRRALTKLNA